MERRRFLRGSAGLLAGATLAGCLGNNAPPPRKAKVFDDVSLDGTTLEVDLRQQIEVESRLENQSGLDAGAAVSSLAPIGVAAAAKGAGARGAGGYSSAPRGRHGWAIWHGGSYSDDWRDDHRDELRMYSAAVATLAIAYVGTDNEYENDTPGPGPGDVSWDRTWDDPSEDTVKTVSIADVSPRDQPREGWYRVGTELVSEDGSRDFGWQAVDMEVDNEAGSWIVDKTWYVKPRV